MFVLFFICICTSTFCLTNSSSSSILLLLLWLCPSFDTLLRLVMTTLVFRMVTMQFQNDTNRFFSFLSFYHSCPRIPTLMFFGFVLFSFREKKDEIDTNLFFSFFLPFPSEDPDLNVYLLRALLLQREKGRNRLLCLSWLFLVGASVVSFLLFKINEVPELSVLVPNFHTCIVVSAFHGHHP